MEQSLTRETNYLINSDIDLLIIPYIFSTNYERKNFKILKCIYYAFGKSNYSIFILKCKEYYFKNIIPNNIINKDNLHLLLKEKIRRGTPKFFPYYTQFYKELGNSSMTFSRSDRRDRIIINYLSLYYGYLVVYTNVSNGECRGYSYEKFYDNNPSYKNMPLTFRFLKSKRIHNLEYYDLVSEGKTIYDNTYILKKDVMLYKLGATWESTDIICIKII